MAIEAFLNSASPINRWRLSDTQFKVVVRTDRLEVDSPTTHAEMEVKFLQFVCKAVITLNQQRKDLPGGKAGVHSCLPILPDADEVHVRNLAGRVPSTHQEVGANKRPAFEGGDKALI